jgi:transcriptional regulator with XRE-family HTH domain
VAKSKYETHVLPKLKIIEAWARNGLTLEQIAKNLGIAVSTLVLHKDKYSEFSEALKRNRDEADVEVENALYKRALGYRYDEVTQEPFLDPQTGEGIMKVTKRVTKEVQPDVTAQIFWLKNRKPAEWRDKQEIAHSGEVNTKHEEHQKITHVIEQKANEDTEFARAILEARRSVRIGTEQSGDAR